MPFYSSLIACGEGGNLEELLDPAGVDSNIKCAAKLCWQPPKNNPHRTPESRNALGRAHPALRAALSVLLTHWAVQAWSSFWGGSLCLWPSKLFWWLKKEVEGCSHTQIIGDGGVTLNSCPWVWLTGLPRAATTCSPAEICCHCSESSGLPMNFWSSTSVPRADECGQACCPRALLDDTDIFNLWMLL